MSRALSVLQISGGGGREGFLGRKKIIILGKGVGRRTI